MVTLLDVESPAPAQIWSEVLEADPRAVVTQTPTWAACVFADGVHRDASRLYRFDDGRRVVVPLARRSRLPAAISPHGSWPFDWGIGGPLADGPLTSAHTAAVFADLARTSGVRITVRTGPDTDPAWADAPPPYVRDVFSSYVLDLRPGFDTIWAEGFRSSVRRAVRKAERSSVRVEVDRSGAFIGDFDRLYRLSVDRWAQEQHEPRLLARWRSSRANPVRKFQAVADRFGKRCAVWIAYLGTRPVAGLIVLRHNESAKYWRGAMDVDLASPVRANDLLHRLAIEAACADGCTSYHMGDTRPGSGLARFKAGFGARECTGSSFRAERLPLTAADARARELVKRAIRFRDL
jgi:lipid II:glycine glycyltransferase (peptidoglycan interpeptide bridge formation enzyme)